MSSPNRPERNPYAPGYRGKVDPMFTPPVPPLPEEPAAPAVPTQKQPAPEVRIGDEERSQAIEVLGSHFAVGRLKLSEYDERVSQAAEASTHGELTALFADLPTLERDAEPMPMYSAAEVERLHQNGRNIKGGLVLGALMTSIIGSIVLSNFNSSVADSLIASLWMLTLGLWAVLYVLKLGPADWHKPSTRQLERERMRALKIEHAMHQQQRRAQRRQIASEMTESAFLYARNKFRK